MAKSPLKSSLRQWKQPVNLEIETVVAKIAAALRPAYMFG